MTPHQSNRLFTTTPRLGVWVVVALVLVGAWMTWRWVAFHRGADLTQDVGGVFDLADDTLAVVALLDVPSKLGIDAAGPVYLQLGNDGAVTRIAREQFDAAVDQAPVPPGWAWPGAVGVAYVRENNHVVAKVIRKTPTGLRMSAPRAEAIGVSIPSTATVGFRCYDGCGEAFPYPVDSADTIDGAVVFQVPMGDRVETLISFAPETTESEVTGFLKELVRWHTPVETRRTLANGRRITERVPMDLDAVPVAVDGVQTTIGNDVYSWTVIAANGLVAASTDANLPREYVALTSSRDREHVASTLVLTKKVCDERPSTFFSQTFPQAFAELPFKVVRGVHSWTVCNEFR